MHGIHTALVTPFAEGGEIDLQAYEALCQRQIQNGIHGLVACGTTGETPTLSLDEQAQLLEVALSASGGRVPVTMGVGTNSTSSTLKRIEAAAKAGAAAGLMVFPYYNKPNPHGLHAHVREAAKVGLPLVLYHVPGRTGQRLSAPLLSELAGYEGVIAVKEATGDLKFGGELLTRTSTAVLSGDDFTFLPLLSMGGVGCISVVSNVDPKRTVAVYDSFVAGDLANAREQMLALFPLVEFLFCDSNPVPCKAAMAELGLCRPTVRLPLGAFVGDSPTPLLQSLGLM
ncbi:MAG: 4-hydroxy-tetrahydrodipicolinate synthase [Proteobacteria bacterium]|jgi:4-hydroxy-tetrahydrodipicolinate synthase|nr:4-hydroxy-tetrahydrodipicolinate synthase [Pseudomonadota bacterium]